MRDESWSWLAGDLGCDLTESPASTPKSARIRWEKFVWINDPELGTGNRPRENMDLAMERRNQKEEDGILGEAK
jgi:hypothetical protein